MNESFVGENEDTSTQEPQTALDDSIIRAQESKISEIELQNSPESKDKKLAFDLKNTKKRVPKEVKKRYIVSKYVKNTPNPKTKKIDF